eukprot:g35626.t1
MQVLFFDWESLQVALRMMPIFYQDLINVRDMVNSCHASPPSGVAAIVREPFLRNPHLDNCGFKWLAERRAAATGMTRDRDMLSGGGLAWMLPQALVHSPMLLIFRHLVQRGAGRLEDLLVGLHLGLARLAIDRSRQQAMEGLISANCLSPFRGC